MAWLTVLELWMVGPSAIGSVKGTPSSMTSGNEVLALNRRTVATEALIAHLRRPSP